jgi:restriction endonuclease S subunit
MDYFDSPECNPRGWSLVKIEELISDLRGGAPLEPEDFVERGFPVLHKGAIKQAGQIEIDPNKKTFADENFARKHKNSIITRNHVAVTLRDLVPSGPAIGMMSYLKNAPYPEYILAQGAYGFLVDAERVIPQYLVWLSNSSHYRRIIRKIAVGSTQIHVRTPVFTSLKIPLPPLTEQKQIASLLARADRLCQLRRHAHDLGDALLQSVFLDMFGEYLNKIECQFGDVLEIPLTNGFFEKNDKYGEGNPIVWVDNLYHTNIIDTTYLRRVQVSQKDLDKYEVLEGDLLFTRSSLVAEGVGQANIVPKLEERIMFESHVIRARVDKKKINPFFALGLFRSQFGKSEMMKRAKTSTMTTIGQDTLYDFPCLLPPLSLQEEFAGVTARVEGLRGRMSEAGRQVEGLFESMLAEAFNA